MRWDADLFYVWPYQAAALLSVLGRPTVLEVHDRPAGFAGPMLFRWILRGRGLRRLLPITESLRGTLERAYGPALRPPRAVVLPSGVDVEAYEDMPRPPQARRSLGLPQAFTAVYTGHLYPGRGVDLLAELARRNPGISFVWAGGEPSDVEAWAARTRAQGLVNVHVLGFVSQARLPLVHAAADVLLMPYARKISVSSGGDTSAFASPLKAFEYMAAGRAILASDLPVLHEVLHPKNAVLLPPEDVGAWNAALRAIRRDGGRRSSLAGRARRDAARFSWIERTRRALEGLDVA
jgi:glycosyltransferase involved in cell wall biosynthesis